MAFATTIDGTTSETSPTLAFATTIDGIRQSGCDKALESLAGSAGALRAYRSFMTQPRLVVPGDTLMITRRTLRRHHLFRPDSAIRQLYLYTLALCARRFGILVHAVTLMSTHEHLIVTDPQGRYPDFLRRLHRLVSLGTKVLRKWEGPTWDHEPSSVVRLLTEQAVIEKLAYVMANPVKAGLVAMRGTGRASRCCPTSLGAAFGP